MNKLSFSIIYTEIKNSVPTINRLLHENAGPKCPSKLRHSSSNTTHFILCAQFCSLRFLGKRKRTTIAFFAKLSTSREGAEMTTCRLMVYVSSSVQDMYLSYESLLNLSLLGDHFPSQVNAKAAPDGQHAPNNVGGTSSERPSSINGSRFITEGCTKNLTTNATTCSCPQRTSPPQRPDELPLPCNEGMASYMLWLVNIQHMSSSSTALHGEISNSRLFRLKQRTLPWHFVHRPGKTNHAADATSRHPSLSHTESCHSLRTPSEPDLQSQH